MVCTEADESIVTVYDYVQYWVQGGLLYDHYFGMGFKDFCKGLINLFNTHNLDGWKNPK